MKGTGKRLRGLLALSEEERRAAYEASLRERQRLEPERMPEGLLQANLRGYDDHLQRGGSPLQRIDWVTTSQEVARRKWQRLTAEGIIIRIPRRFYDDHNDRDLPAPDSMRRTTRHVWIRRDPNDPTYQELVNDAQHYADPHGPDLVPRLKAAAKALLRALGEEVP